MEYGKITKQERLELNDLAIKSLSVETLFKRILMEQEIYLQKREEWFIKLREKYNIPADIDITIKEDNFIIKSEE